MIVPLRVPSPGTVSGFLTASLVPILTDIRFESLGKFSPLVSFTVEVNPVESEIFILTRPLLVVMFMVLLKVPA